MNPLLHIVLTLCASLAYQVHATLTSGHYRDHVIEERHPEDTWLGSGLPWERQINE